MTEPHKHYGTPCTVKWCGNPRKAPVKPSWKPARVRLQRAELPQSPPAAKRERISPPAAARLLGVSRSWLDLEVKRGRLQHAPFFPMQRHWFWRDEVVAFIYRPIPYGVSMSRLQYDTLLAQQRDAWPTRAELQALGRLSQ